jgi:hypothetical protein
MFGYQYEIAYRLTSVVFLFKASGRIRAFCCDSMLNWIVGSIKQTIGLETVTDGALCDRLITL